MIDKSEDTPPPSPGVGGGGQGDDDELFEDEVDEEIEVIDGEAEVRDTSEISQRNILS